MTRPRAAWLAAAVLAALAMCVGRVPQVRPNVLVLVMDTTRADRCGFDGYARPTTPCLDEFARDAVVFRQAWSPANWTGPAHASLFTGLVPVRHRFHEGSHPFLRPGVPVVAERFAAAGYETACFTNNVVVSPAFGLARGFTHFDALYRQDDRSRPWAVSTHDRAAAFAEAVNAAGRPFFVFINDLEPHQPYDPPPRDAAPFIRGSPTPAQIEDARTFLHPRTLAYDLGLEDISDGKLHLLSDLYDGEIHCLDREIGVLLGRLRADGILDSTVVVILGDHGEHLGEHRLIEHASGLYAQVLRVPLIVRFPGRFDGGRVVDDVVRVEDVPPTLLDVCGLPVLRDIDGVSLTHGVAGRLATAVQPPRNWASDLAIECFPGVDASRLAIGIESVFDGHRHLLAFSDGRRELYDPVADPGETDDLASREPSEIARLAKLLHSGK